MRTVLSIAKRQLETYFSSPITYVVTAGMLAILGYSFSIILLFSRQASLRPLFSQLSLIFVIVAPLLTMHLISDEVRSGTIELLLTSPVREHDIVLGKFLAAFGVFALMLTPTAYYALVLRVFGNPDWGPIASLYTGVALLGGALISLGALASALTSHQVLAAALGAGFILVLWFLPAAAAFVAEPFKSILTYAGLSSHFLNFTKGVIDTSDVIFYLSIIAGALFLATHALRARRWR